MTKKGESLNRNSPEVKITIIFVVLIIVFFASLALGRFYISPVDVMRVLLGKLGILHNEASDVFQAVVLSVRLPRVIAAMLVGGALSMAGAASQGVFRNPMVSPNILGAAAGSGFGAALGILFSFNFLFIQISAFIFGLIAVLITFFGSHFLAKKGDITLTMILTGMVVSSLFTAFVSLIKYVADPNSKLPTIVFWLMGSLSSVTALDIYLITIPLAIGFVPLILLRWKINLLAFGDDEAKSMGISTFSLRLVIIFGTTLLTAASISICGMIGWIGLIVPHMCRYIVGQNYKYVIPASGLLGSVFLLIVDNFARNVAAVEIPLGILTSLIGGPFFLYLLFNNKKENF